MSEAASSVAFEMRDLEPVVHIALSELYPFPDHPFKLRDDDSMREMVESVKEYGVVSPILVKPREESGYVILSGHRRKHACELAGLNMIPAIIRAVDNDTAIILMVDSNLQREELLPSEKALAYKMKYEAIKRRVGRCTNCVEEKDFRIGTHSFDKKTSLEIIAAESGESGTQLHRYLRLAELIPALLQMVDDKKLGISAAVEFSFLKPDEQEQLLDCMEGGQKIPSYAQSKQMKQLSQSGELNRDRILSVLNGIEISENVHSASKFKQSPSFSIPTAVPKKQVKTSGATAAQFPPMPSTSVTPLDKPTGQTATKTAQTTQKSAKKSAHSAHSAHSATKSDAPTPRKVETAAIEKPEKSTAKVPVKPEAPPKTQVPDKPKPLKSTVPQVQPPVKTPEQETFAESVARLKNPDKDCRCTPEIFCDTFTEFVNTIHRSLERYSTPYYAAVFPALTGEQLQTIQQQVDAIHATLDKFYHIMNERTDST